MRLSRGQFSRLSTLFGIACVVFGAAFAAAGSRNLGLQAQTADPSASDGIVLGVVLDPRTGRTIPEAMVVISEVTKAGTTKRVLSSETGQFLFENLPQGNYRISATAPGYLDGEYGRQRPGGLSQTLPLKRSERVSSIRIALWKPSSLSGQVTDEAGEQLVSVPVQLLSLGVLAGRRMMVPVATVSTDDRGLYRFSSLPPGDYSVVVPSVQTTIPAELAKTYEDVLEGGLEQTSTARDLASASLGTMMSTISRSGGFPRGELAFLSSFVSSTRGRSTSAPIARADGDFWVYPTRYYRNARSASEAEVISLRDGRDLTGVDLRLDPLPTSTVSGTVTGPDGGVITALSLVPADGDSAAGSPFETATSFSDAMGRFTFLGVPRGEYWLRVVKTPALGRGTNPAAAAAATLWANLSVSVDAPVIRDLSVLLKPGFTTQGRIQFGDGSEAPLPTQIQRTILTLEPAHGRRLDLERPARVPPTASGEFLFHQLPPGQYLLRATNVPNGWRLKSVTLETRDLLERSFLLDRDLRGIVVTFTRAARSCIYGRVPREAALASKNDGSDTVLVFPAQSQLWVDYGRVSPRFRASKLDSTGQFRVDDLPAGRYLVAAIPNEPQDGWQRPEGVTKLMGEATMVSLDDGDCRPVNLRLASQAQ